MENKPPEAIDEKNQLIAIFVVSIILLIVIPIVANVINWIKNQQAGNVAVAEAEESKWPLTMSEGKLEFKGNPGDIFKKLGLNQLTK